MYSKTQPLTDDTKVQKSYQDQFQQLHDLLFGLLDTPVKTVHHIGGTAHFSYPTEPILDILVGVNNLHDITALDEKRLNYAGFYRIHHGYKKKAMMVCFNNMTELKQTIRLHILQIESKPYHHYLAMQEALTHQTALQAQFMKEKTALHQKAQTIREYEEGKSALFDKLSRQFHIN